MEAPMSGPMDDENLAGCKAVALFSWEAQRDVEISFKAGDQLMIEHTDPSGWWFGCLFPASRPSGYFPSNYVRVLPDAQPQQLSNGNAASGNNVNPVASPPSGASGALLEPVTSTLSPPQNAPRASPQRVLEDMRAAAMAPRAEAPQATFSINVRDCDICAEPSVLRCSSCATNLCADCDSIAHVDARKAKHERVHHELPAQERAPVTKPTSNAHVSFGPTSVLRSPSPPTTTTLPSGLALGTGSTAAPISGFDSTLTSFGPEQQHRQHQQDSSLYDVNSGAPPPMRQHRNFLDPFQNVGDNSNNSQFVHTAWNDPPAFPTLTPQRAVRGTDGISRVDISAVSAVAGPVDQSTSRIYEAGFTRPRTPPASMLEPMGASSIGHHGPSPFQSRVAAQSMSRGNDGDGGMNSVSIHFQTFPHLSWGDHVTRIASSNGIIARQASASPLRWGDVPQRPLIRQQFLGTPPMAMRRSGVPLFEPVYTLVIPQIHSNQRELLLTCSKKPDEDRLRISLDESLDPLDPNNMASHNNPNFVGFLTPKDKGFQTFVLDSYQSGGPLARIRFAPQTTSTHVVLVALLGKETANMHEQGTAGGQLTGTLDDYGRPQLTLKVGQSERVVCAGFKETPHPLANVNGPSTTSTSVMPGSDDKFVLDFDYPLNVLVAFAALCASDWYLSLQRHLSATGAMPMFHEPKWWQQQGNS